MPYFAENCNAGESIFGNPVAADPQYVNDGGKGGMSGAERRSKVNELGMEWLSDLISRVESCHWQVTSDMFEWR